MDILLGIALSSHLDFTGEYNQIHPHARLEAQSISTGMYYNSEEKVSVYAGYMHDVGPITAEIGVVTGYNALETIQPFGRLYYEHNNGTRFFYSPGGELQSDGTITQGHIFGVEFLFKLN